MQNVVPKADILISLVGSSAMPNLIGIVTRLKEKGKVYFVHTNETKPISENLDEFIRRINEIYKDKINIQSEQIAIENYDNPMEVYKEISKKFKYIKQEINGETDLNIELNYTGGTKVISSIACTVSKELFKNYNFFLTYLDGEKSKLYINSVKNINKSIEQDYCAGNGTFPLTIEEVVNIHKKGKYGTENGFVQSKFSKDMFNYLCKHMGDRENIIEYLNLLYTGLEKCKDSKSRILIFLDKFLAEHNLLEEYKSSKDILYSFYLNESEVSSKKIIPIKKSLQGMWLEEVVHEILDELKTENVIEDYVCNLKIREEEESDLEMEIDFIAMKDYKLYYFSVSTAEDIEKTKLKLYEVKQRAKILSEVESAVATITFVESKKEIIEGYKNIWQDNPNNLLMITWSDVPKTKELIKEWIMRRGANV